MSWTQARLLAKKKPTETAFAVEGEQVLLFLTWITRLDSVNIQTNSLELGVLCAVD